MQTAPDRLSEAPTAPAPGRGRRRARRWLLRLAVVIALAGLAHCASPAGVAAVAMAKDVTFVCSGRKQVQATFYPGTDRQVDLRLSDGRRLSVPRALSASGARYATADESFVFWNKGKTAFITEGSPDRETYSNCVIR